VNGAAVLVRLAGRHSAARRSRRSNERSLARRSRDMGSFHRHHLFERFGQRGQSRVVHSIYRSRKASGGSLGGVNHLILRGKETGLTTSLVRAGTCKTNRRAAIFEP